MASKAALSRLRKEYVSICQNPIAGITTVPLETNILEWHYVINGPSETLLEGGEYYGKLVFPTDYPYKPPSIYMFTPNGCLETDQKICTSFSDFHPESWNPMWRIDSMLVGLRSFMVEKSPTMLSISTSEAEKKAYAKISHAWNRKNKKFVELFPELSKAEPEVDDKRIEEEKQATLVVQDAKKNMTCSRIIHIVSHPLVYLALSIFVLIIALLANMLK